MENAFDILGLPRSFDLTRAQVGAAYRRAMISTHPDVQAADGAEVDHAANLNIAKRTLEDPLSRAEHLMLLLHGPLKGREPSLPSAFLMEMMEVRETAEAQIESEGETARQRWRAWADERRSDFVKLAAESFAVEHDPARTRELISRWRYIERMIQQLDPHYDVGRS